MPPVYLALSTIIKIRKHLLLYTLLKNLFILKLECVFLIIHIQIHTHNHCTPPCALSTGEVNNHLRILKDSQEVIKGQQTAGWIRIKKGTELREVFEGIQ